MRTPVCESLGIEYPIFAFGHCGDVVAAVSRAGGLGVLGAAGELLPSSHHVLMRTLRCSAPYKLSSQLGRPSALVRPAFSRAHRFASWGWGDAHRTRVQRGDIREPIDHPARDHHDHANAAALALVLAEEGGRVVAFDPRAISPKLCVLRSLQEFARARCFARKLLTPLPLMLRWCKKRSYLFAH